MKLDLGKQQSSAHKQEREDAATALPLQTSMPGFA